MNRLTLLALMNQMDAALASNRCDPLVLATDTLCLEQKIEATTNTITSVNISLESYQQTVTIPRHKSTHPADIQDRRRRRKQKL